MLVQNNQSQTSTQEQAYSLENIIKLNASHNILSMRMQELRFDSRTQISQVKAQLERRFGSAAGNLTL